jgi:molybdenum cofactor cytidylyltransferase
MWQISTGHFVGILLAAGKGMRFDPTGTQDKLMQPLANGDAVAVAAARSLLAAVPSVLAVVRPRAAGLATSLQAIGCEVIECPSADQGMGASLIHALMHARDAAGWIIALADMLYVQAATSIALIDAIRHGANIAVPTCDGLRGNPVAFSSVHLPSLLRLYGDQGARRLLTAYPVTEIAVDDAGIFRDVDTVLDLAPMPGRLMTATL